MHYALSLEYNFCISCSPHSLHYHPSPHTSYTLPLQHVFLLCLLSITCVGVAGACSAQFWNWNSIQRSKKNPTARGAEMASDRRERGRNMVFPIYFIYSWEPFCIFHGFCLSAQIENIIETINSMLLVSRSVSFSQASLGLGGKDGLSNAAAAPFPVIPISSRVGEGN